jgi:hypothetical protein
MEAEENNLEISGKSKKKKRKKVIALFSDAEITMNQLAEIIINSYLRKHPELLYKNDPDNEDHTQLNNAA